MYEYAHALLGDGLCVCVRGLESTWHDGEVKLMPQVSASDEALARHHTLNPTPVQVHRRAAGKDSYVAPASASFDFIASV